MRPTKTIFDDKARQAILRGVNSIYEPVKRTLGPNGRNGLLYRTFGRSSRITNDGYTVAEVQENKDIFVRLTANTFKEAVKRTNEKVGDGTTTTTVIGGSLYNKIYSLFSESSGFNNKNQNPVKIRKQILESAEKVKNEIKKVAKKVKTIEELEKIAIISVEDEKLGKLIAQMAWEVGVDGFIDVVEGYKGEIETEIIKGHRFSAKVPAKGFLNNAQKFEMVAVDCPVLVTNYELNNTAQADRLFSKLLQKNTKVIVIAPNFSEEVLKKCYLTMFNINNSGQRTPTGIEIYPVAVPSLRTDQFDDLAIYCGSRFIDKTKGTKLENIQESDVGFLEKLVVKDIEIREDAIALGGGGNRNEKIKFKGEEMQTESAVKNRIETLKGQLEETKDIRFKQLIERRIASMNSAVGIIKVGGSTNAESLYRKLKIEDGVFACKAALRGGYVKGGGLCLKEISDNLENNDIIKQAIREPYDIIQNSIEGGVKITNDIIDPAEAVYYAVEFSTQVVANLATVEVITAEAEDPLTGEGEFEIAKWLREMVISKKVELGQIKENEVEMWKDAFGGLSYEEHNLLDKS